MKKKYKILFVEDSFSDAELIEYTLLNANIDFAAKWVDTAEQFKDELTIFNPDVIICDQSLPQFDAYSAMRILKETGAETPFILVSGSISDREAIDYLQWGAYDYILKSNMARLPFTVKNAVTERALAKGRSIAEFEHLQLRKSHRENSERSKDITDSIMYAKEIQNALMPGQSYIHKFFPESFLINMPKHIVSGDFYWFSECNGKYIVAVGDCTGHGVPGALISMMGYNKLDHIVNVSGITNPSMILSNLNSGMRDTFRMESDGTAIRDGMDIAICVIDPANNSLKFSGANRPLYYISNRELGIVKGDKKCIGGVWNRQGETYMNHTFCLDSLSAIYLFTDGILDQFGGDRGKKFLSKRFNRLLPSLQNCSMDDQKQILVSTLNEWKGEHEQTDDICMLGIKLEK